MPNSGQKEILFMWKILSVITLALLSVVSLSARAENAFSLNGNVSVSNSYFFRGISQAEDQFVLTPSVQAGYKVADGVQVLGGLNTVFLSDTDNLNGPDSSTSSWYEATLAVGARFTVAKQFVLGVDYNFYSSPSDSFKNVQEAVFSVSYQDNLKLFPEFTGLNPYVLLAVDLDNSRGLSDEGQYLEVGVNPTAKFVNVPLVKTLVVSLPTRAGFGFNDYFGNGTELGYIGVGPQFKIPLNDHVSITAGVDVLFLNNDLGKVNEGGDVEVVGSIVLNLSL